MQRVPFREKDQVPQADGLLRGGVCTCQLLTQDVDDLRLFPREARRAELAHCWTMFCGLLFVACNSPLTVGLLVIYDVAVNLPFIVIQRYTRVRAWVLIQRIGR